MKFLAIILLGLIFSSVTFPASATIRNGALTENDIEFCHEVYPQYKALGLSWFVKNYHYSIEARVCASLYEDPVWKYEGDDRVDKLIRQSKYFVQLEIEESEDEAQSGQVDPTPAGISEKSNSIMKVSSDGTIFVIIETTDATAGEYMGVDIIFEDSEENPIQHVNYDLEVRQNQQEFLIVKSQHAENGKAEHWTRPLFSDDPVDIQAKILGIGLPKERANWSGPNDESLTFQAVPEFGLLTLTILMMSLMLLVPIQKFRQIQ
ncbi:MAG: hypothetical protein ACT4N5_01600 [Nitrosopumilaceae archaeon]